MITGLCLILDRLHLFWFIEKRISGLHGEKQEAAEMKVNMAFVTVAIIVVEFISFWNNTYFRFRYFL